MTEEYLGHNPLSKACNMVEFTDEHLPAAIIIRAKEVISDETRTLHVCSLLFACVKLLKHFYN